MTEVTRVIPASADDVFDVLADGWSYAGWVVGASHIRGVDPEWPAEGSSIHHNSGPWPVQVSDRTTVLRMERDRLLELDARLWVFGKVTIRLTLVPLGPNRTEVRMVEKPTGGPARLAPEPLRSMVLRPRNTEALARLADMAAGRGSERRT
ncbi:Polyketide cyclase / dehydrase and lipid transport [Amycolatopsis arida]|uniref:Polyketide cyclase / dehydrase and lipid transport n=1 Tax=Amycolatopsis arida TaxID=587909 RepID=A0A1I5YE86_9PSEU|nr:SRPBCC family protein [Amycolatopsis arida]TDX90453.1 polyketide cyclase/dehydrase/lipid transport protein [Amycolatopsis arida]SFQ42512.1 Polyketide cyclase / dehydrase and lipid transport [Amycolatopsis arida]